MKKTLLITTLGAIAATHLFAASYWVVTKDGSRYETKAKWTIVNGKAMITMTNGNVMALDPSTIDVAKSEEVTRFGGGELMGVEQRAVTSTSKASTLGTAIRLRKLPPSQPAAAAPPPPLAAAAANTPPPPPVEAGAGLGSDVINKFERAFENVGIFEHKLAASGPRGLRADLTADNEDKVFHSLSATAFLMMHIPGVQIDSVDLFMKTTTGGAAGRFHVTHEDAQALEAKTITPEMYFVLKVLL